MAVLKMRRMRRELLVALVLGVPWLPAGCRAPGSTPPSGQLKVRRGDFRGRVLLSGEVAAVRQTPLVVPRLPQWQTSIRWMAPEGSRVTAGERVLELDASSQARDLEEARLAESRAANEEKRQRAENLRVEIEKRLAVERERTAVAKAHIDAAIPRSLRPAREWQEAQLALARAETALAKAEEELEARLLVGEAELELKRIAVEKATRERSTAEQAIRSMTLTAPIDGVLLAGTQPWEQRKFREGDVVWVGLTLATLPDLSQMQVEAWLPDVDDGRIAPGMQASSTLDAYPGTSYPGRVLEVAPVAEEAAPGSLRRRFRVLVSLDRSDPARMLPGMSARVDVVTEEASGVLLAPREALDLAAEPPRARTLAGAEREVRLGPCNALECVVLEGLAEGEGLAAAGRGRQS